MAVPGPNQIVSSYRRFLIDMHTPDWDPRFLGEFSAEHLAAAVASANATTITVPANNHVGLNFWPSSVGRMHRALHGRDQLADCLAAARRHGLATVVYYAIAYVEWYWEQHPDARLVFADGEARRLRISRAGMADRFRVVCHNNAAYREFVLAQVTELAEGYTADGFNIDMTMWPGPCYCAACRERFRSEEGHELPTVVDWKDPVWRAFAARRAAWLAEFALIIAERIRSIRPDATVVHQSGPYFSDWWIGGSDDLAAATDWLSADTYTTREGLSFALKLSNRLSRIRPAELINTWTAPAIFEHTVTRTPEEMEIVTSVAIAHDCALSVIDAVDPLGTIADPNYAMMAPIFDRVRRLEPYLGGTMLHDVEIYRSFRGAFDDDESGHSVAELRYPDEREEFTPSRANHRASSILAGGALQAEHVPFGVITRDTFGGLDPREVLVISNLTWLEPSEIDAIEGFLRRGGRAYVSGDSPLLADPRFGLRGTGRTHGIATYVAPTGAGSEILEPFTTRRPLTIHGAQQRIEVVGDAEVLATTTLPFIRPGGERYTSTLADPPGLATTDPAIVEVEVGEGRLLYSAGVLEAEEHPSQRAVFVRLVRRLLDRAPQVTGVGPRCVELTAFEQGDRRVIFALNRPEGAELVPISGFEVDVADEESLIRAVRLLPDGPDLEFERADGRARFVLPTFGARAAVLLEL